jgi:flagellar basal-body rod modification protein FlgD
MDVNPYSSIGLATSQSVADQASKNKKSLGQDEFLKLMTTQLRNQDPMEPMDNGEFLAQIAQFGTVDGVNNLLSSFNNLATSLQSSQALQASNLIGRNVLVQNDEGYLPTQGLLEGAVQLDSSATAVTVNVYSLNGDLMGRVDLGAQAPGLTPFVWDGTTVSGMQAAPGRYRLEVEATRGGTTENLNPMVTSSVKSLTLGGLGQEMQVELDHLGQVNFSQINQIL